jgi:hypothetical protein
MVLVGSILSYGVKALIGSVDLESQGRGRAPHLIVGGVVHPSHQATFGRWVTILVVTA